MAQVKTIGEAVRNMSVHMANMYYYLTKAVIEDFGDEAKKSFERAIIEFGHERGKAIREEVLAAGLPLTMENLDRFYDIPIAEGWDLHRTYENDMKMNITDSCTFATVWLEKDWSEVGHIYCLTDSNLNHTGIYLYSKGKIMIHLTFDYQSDEGCTTPGQYLRYHRTFQGLTTRELAEKVGVVPATLVLYENDRHPIKHSTAVALANVLGIDRSRLLDEYTVFVDYPYSSLLKKVRRELSFTQMQMAEVIGIGQTTYSGWEREVRVPRRKEHEKILAAMKKLKVDVDTYLCQPNPL